MIVSINHHWVLINQFFSWPNFALIFLPLPSPLPPFPSILQFRHFWWLIKRVIFTLLNFVLFGPVRLFFPLLLILLFFGQFVVHIFVDRFFSTLLIIFDFLFQQQFQPLWLWVPILTFPFPLLLSSIPFHFLFIFSPIHSFVFHLLNFPSHSPIIPFTVVFFDTLILWDSILEDLPTSISLTPLYATQILTFELQNLFYFLPFISASFPKFLIIFCSILLD